jgi:hypothetical protein
VRHGRYSTCSRARSTPRCATPVPRPCWSWGVSDCAWAGPVTVACGASGNSWARGAKSSTSSPPAGSHQQHARCSLTLAWVGQTSQVPQRSRSAASWCLARDVRRSQIGSRGGRHRSPRSPKRCSTGRTRRSRRRRRPPACRRAAARTRCGCCQAKGCSLLTRSVDADRHGGSRTPTGCWTRTWPPSTQPSPHRRYRSVCTGATCSRCWVTSGRPGMREVSAGPPRASQPLPSSRHC